MTLERSTNSGDNKNQILKESVNITSLVATIRANCNWRAKQCK
jgi:hypothetical protein